MSGVAFGTRAAAVVSSRSFRSGMALGAVAFVAIAGMFLASSGAKAGDVPPPSETVWLCKPGIDDNPCLDGSFGGTRYLPSGATEPFSYGPTSKPAFDCFYVYPTQSEQNRLNADYSRDPELKAVAVNQASQFSRICDVYAPVYRQYTNRALGELDTLSGPEIDQIRDIAYDSMRSAFADFVSNHSKGRGFVLIGHSQGASHLSRLIDEEIDPNPVLRKRMISAIVPGSNNIYVPKGGVIGGNLEAIPACTRGDQLGCVMAWSLYLNKAGTGIPGNSSFGRLETGYWVYPEARPDSSTYEVLCVNPGVLSGNDGVITPLANLPAFLGQINAVDPWTEGQGLYRADCRKGDDASWLDMTPVQGASASILDGVLPLINSNAGGLHTGDVNLVLGDLIEIASRQGARYVSWRKAVARSRSADRALERGRAELSKATAKAARAASACRASGSKGSCRKARSAAAEKRRIASRVAKLKVAAGKAARAAERAYGSA